MTNLTRVYLIRIHQGFSHSLRLLLSLFPFRLLRVLLLCVFGFDSLCHYYVTRFNLSFKWDRHLIFVILRHKKLDHAKGASHVVGVKGNLELGTHQLIEGILIYFEVIEG
jgi:hypothetical protein